jgi:hypothetical protein
LLIDYFFENAHEPLLVLTAFVATDDGHADCVFEWWAALFALVAKASHPPPMRQMQKMSNYRPVQPSDSCGQWKEHCSFRVV